MFGCKLIKTSLLFLFALLGDAFAKFDAIVPMFTGISLGKIGVAFLDFIQTTEIAFAEERVIKFSDKRIISHRINAVIMIVECGNA